jgi:hypothetical protein
MSKNRRILFELLAPPFLAAIITIAGDKSSEWYMIIAGFFPSLFFFYVFGIIPSAIYTLAMELWFYARLRERCGFICTSAVSGILGCAAGFAGAWSGILLGFLTRPDDYSLAKLGLVVGLLVGFFVSQKQTSAA